VRRRPRTRHLNRKATTATIREKGMPGGGGLLPPSLVRALFSSLGAGGAPRNLQSYTERSVGGHSVAMAVILFYYRCFVLSSSNGIGVRLFRCHLPTTPPERREENALRASQGQQNLLHPPERRRQRPGRGKKRLRCELVKRRWP